MNRQILFKNVIGYCVNQKSFSELVLPQNTHYGNEKLSTTANN